MSARQRIVMIFICAGDELLVKRPATASSYAGRLSTVSGIVGAGETAAVAARRALEEELPAVAGLAGLGTAGLSVDFSDTVKKQQVSWRVYPFLSRLPDGAPRPSPPGARWVTPDEVIAAGAVAETVPELDEALARVWDPPAALPPQWRTEARALAGARAGSRDLAGRAAAMVAGGAPPERVAAVRPGLARIVNAARAAVNPERDVAADLAAAARAEARAVSSAVEGALRVGAVGPVPEAPGRSWLTPADDLDLLLLSVEAVLPRGDVVAHPGALEAARRWHGRIPVLACADAWATWEDELPPPATDGLEVVPKDLVTRVIGLWN